MASREVQVASHLKDLDSGEGLAVTDLAVTDKCSRAQSSLDVQVLTKGELLGPLLKVSFGR